MAKKQQTTSTSTIARNPKSTATLRTKARKVIQSNGIPFFKNWMVTEVTGKMRRPSCRSVDPRLCDNLISRYERKGRAMDIPKPVKVKETD